MIASLGLVLDETVGQDNEQPSAQPRVPLAVAEKALKDCLSKQMDEALSWHGSRLEGRMPASHKAFKITTGVGKSEQLRREIAEYVPEAKRLGLPHRALYLVPTHSLGDEARKKMPAGITTALWQGRQATSVSTGEPLCRNLEAVKAALAIGADVEGTACRKDVRGGDPVVCPFYEACGYQAQKKAAKAADVVFAAHEIGFQPPEILGDGFGLVVIDEGFWQDGIIDTRIVISGLALDLKAFPVRDNGVNVNSDDTEHLADMIARLQRALDGLPDGYVTKAAIAAEGLLAADRYEDGSCTKARKYEWRRKVDAGLRPGDDAAAREKALDRYQFLGQIPRRAAMWRALDELLGGDADASGRLRIETTPTKEGSIRYLRILGRKDINEKIAELPIIHADATMQIDLVRHYLPRIEMALDLDVDAPHMRVTQVIGLPVGKLSLQALAPGKRRPDQEERITRKRQRLADFVRHQVRDGKGLVVTYKDIEADFIQDGTETAHFGAIEGIDRWKDADVMVTIGRPLPRAEDTARYVAALTGEAVVLGDMVKKGAGISMTSGAARVLEVRVYENIMAETVRRAVTEAAIVQAVGRVRGVRRGPHNPVKVFMVLNDTVTPLQVDEVIEFQDEEPDRIDEMILRGLVPQMPTDATRLYPGLFGTRNAAKMAYRKAKLDVVRGTRLVSTHYKEILIMVGHQPRLVKFQPAGKGQTSRLAIFSPELFKDIRSTLETGLGLAAGAGLGPLAEFEVLPAGEGALAGPGT
jgi:hypothetical protein